MAYTEKVSLNGTALSFLLYECLNSSNSQEGFLIGDVTSEIKNHISDSHNDSARLDTQIAIRTVLPLPSVSLFYLPSGSIKEDVLSDLLSNVASEVVGWYKYRKCSSIKPTFRDKLISKGLQKYFEKIHSKKTFVTCNLSSKVSIAGSTHTLIYRFGKINCFDMYEYIEDVTANLGEKVTGYKKANRLTPHCIFNKIVKESNVHNNNTNDAILMIQQAVDVRLVKEAQIAAKNESTIRELEAEIKQMNSILAEKQASDLDTSYNKMLEEKYVNKEVEMVDACIEALKTPPTIDLLSMPNVVINSNSDILTDSENSVQLIENNVKDRSPSPVLPSSSSKPPTLNYAAVLKKKSETNTSKKSSNFTEDLISFDVEDRPVQKPIIINDNATCFGESSPEY
ncbi:BRCA1-A complex subunit Abraxas 1-like [Zerene cesonia]|uniref:BRCA1-A complex subunit Abraxas 1-like n=1 Tax=Zerene cesonia TaxID=33412 RepID=UPI0018E5A07E|nr:BRCA1-A complex subunit Abraxas 1-like [Zerene cesonia]